MENCKKSVLLLGVGGISMYQLALSFKDLGYDVFGYDATDNKYTRMCEKSGVKFCNCFNKTFLKVDFIVCTAAIKQENRFLKNAKKLGIPVFDRAFVLGEMCKKFKCVIAVAGTHGKSTTASLIYQILRVGGVKVSCHIGAEVSHPRFKLGDDYLVVEACEFNKSFLSIFPNIVVVTNVEAEHMDSYKTMFNLRSAFLTLVKRAKVRFAFEEKSTKFLSNIKDINFVRAPEKKFCSFLKGEYNQKNIALASAVCLQIGLDEDVVKRVVKTFKGVPRRFEYIGGNKPKIFIDYAHHPTEIEAFTNTFNAEFGNNLIVFQPHTFSRTKLLIKDFVKVLSKAKNLIIFKEYAAREKHSCGLSAYELFLNLKKAGADCKYVANFKRIAKFIKNVDAVAFVGAGDIDKIALKFK